MRLTAKAVDTLAISCLATTPDNPDTVMVEGVVRTFGFDKAKVAMREQEIVGLLEQLPKEFQRGGGGGWTFLNACNDLEGNQWTGSQQTMEALFCLGIAAGKAKWLLPRDLWGSLPGGVPYVVVN